MKISKRVTELWVVQEFVGNSYQRGITWKLRKGEQLFLRATHRLNLIHIPIKLHEDIMHSERVIECTRV